MASPEGEVMIRNRVMAAFAIAVAVMGLTVAVTVPVANADVLPNV